MRTRRQCHLLGLIAAFLVVTGLLFYKYLVELENVWKSAARGGRISYYEADDQHAIEGEEHDFKFQSTLLASIHT